MVASGHFLQFSYEVSLLVASDGVNVAKKVTIKEILDFSSLMADDMTKTKATLRFQ